MSNFSGQHDTVTYEEALEMARQGLTVGLEGWWSKGVGVAGSRENFSKVLFRRVYSLYMNACAMLCAGVGHLL